GGGSPQPDFASQHPGERRRTPEHDEVLHATRREIGLRRNPRGTRRTTPRATRAVVSERIGPGGRGRRPIRHGVSPGNQALAASRGEPHGFGARGARDRVAASRAERKLYPRSVTDDNRP